MIKYCLRCGKRFTSTGNRQKYCTPKCRDAKSITPEQIERSKDFPYRK